MKHWALPFLVACACCFQPASEALAEPSLAITAPAPRPEGPVSDAANLIPAEEEAALDNRLREIFDNTQSALIVVTVSSLGGQDVAAYTNALAQRWEVGGARGGVVLLIAPNERQVRIETDDKVRTRLTDEQCAEIIQKVLLPRFRSGDFAGGIAAGAEAIASHL